jgi:hypothetical protein
MTRLDHDNTGIINRSKYKNLYLLLFWFAPLLINISSGRLATYNLDFLVVYLLFATEMLGLIYILFFLRVSRLSINVLIVICILFGSMLYSDITEIKLVAALASYSLIVHVIAKRFPLEIWNQYYLICIILSWMTIIEIFAYFLTGEFLFSFRNPELIRSFFPRVTPVFDEMSHQSFFIMPAALIAYRSNKKHFALLLIGVLCTFSVAAIILFLPLFIYFNASNIRLKTINILTLIFVLLCLLLIVLFALDLIFGKFVSIFNPESLYSSKKAVSAVNILVGIDLLRGFSLGDWLFGFGYFGYGDKLHVFLNEVPLNDYYLAIGIFEDKIGSIGIVNMIIYFGALISSFVIYLLWRAKKYAIDRALYKLAIIIVIASMLKNSHTVDYFVHLFFVFGLAWCNTDMSLFRDKSKNSVARIKCA